MRQVSNPVRPNGVGSIDKNISIDEDQCLSAFHRLVQRVPVRNVNQNAAAMEDRQGRQIGSLLLRSKQIPGCCLHQLRHGSPLPGDLALELGHDGVVNVEGRLHMEKHVTDMDRWEIALIHGLQQQV